MEYAQFSQEHLQFCMANQSALIDQFYKELQVKRQQKRLKALEQMAKAKAKQQQPTINLK
jgi:Zn-dependent oligopeptidase